MRRIGLARVGEGSTGGSEAESLRGVRRDLATAGIGALLLAVFVLTALLAPALAPYSPEAYSAAPLQSPTPAHPLGSNDVGQDLLSALLYGTRISLLVAVVAGSTSLGVALLVGVTAGAVGGLVDSAAMRLVDVLMALPHLPLMIVVAAFLGPGLGNVILVIAALAWVRPARLLRSQVLSLRSRGYVRHARLFGGGWGYVMRRHLLPALAPILCASFVALASRAVIMEAGLAFLGIGDPTFQSWGMMMRHALNFRGIYLTSAWLWWLLPPGLCLTALVAGLMMLGTAAESYANPRLARHPGGR
jgi:ABC-type dipeptide/oligopeptide/nickel transport system permease subunit